MAECKDCIHFEVCAYVSHDLPICDNFASDVAPVRHERWIHKEGKEFSYCSACHYPVSYMWDMTNYCPNCGVKMGDDNI